MRRIARDAARETVGQYLRDTAVMIAQDADTGRFVRPGQLPPLFSSTPSYFDSSILYFDC